MCLLQAKRLISLAWKDVNRPSIGRWLREMSSCLTMERITYMVKDRQDTFTQVWGPFLNFVEQNDVGDILANEGNSE